MGSALWILLAVAAGVAGAYELSDCAKKCLEPMARIEKTISYVYRHYDDVCDALEQTAKCAQEKCGQEDHALVHQYTTFYRVHCIELEEELEEHLPCLREASYKADFVCREKCTEKVDKTADKAEKQRNVCKTVECSTMCYFKQFVQSCPDAKDTLMKLNVRNADEMRRLTHEKHVGEMDLQCQRIHDGKYIRSQLLETLEHGA